MCTFVCASTCTCVMEASSSRDPLATEAGSSSVACRLHQECGVGYSFKFGVSEDRLPPGWWRERKSSKYTMWYDDRGSGNKSSIEVELNWKRGVCLGVKVRTFVMCLPPGFIIPTTVHLQQVLSSNLEKRSDHKNLCMLHTALLTL